MYHQHMIMISKGVNDSMFVNTQTEFDLHPHRQAHTRVCRFSPTQERVQSTNERREVFCWLNWNCFFRLRSRRRGSPPQRRATCPMRTSWNGWPWLEELPRSCWRTQKCWSSSCPPWRPTCTWLRTTGALAACPFWFTVIWVTWPQLLPSSRQLYPIRAPAPVLPSHVFWREGRRSSWPARSVLWFLHITESKTLLSSTAIRSLLVSRMTDSLEKHHVRRFHRQDASWVTFLPEGLCKWRSPVGLHHQTAGNRRHGLFVMNLLQLWFLECLESRSCLRNIMTVGSWLEMTHEFSF